MVSAKQCAINLFPLSTSNGGQSLMLSVKTLVPVKERGEIALALASVFIALAIAAMWAVALALYMVYPV